MPSNKQISYVNSRKQTKSIKSVSKKRRRKESTSSVESTVKTPVREGKQTTVRSVTGTPRAKRPKFADENSPPYRASVRTQVAYRSFPFGRPPRKPLKESGAGRPDSDAKLVVDCSAKQREQGTSVKTKRRNSSTAKPEESSPLFLPSPDGEQEEINSDDPARVSLFFFIEELDGGSDKDPDFGGLSRLTGPSSQEIYGWPKSSQSLAQDSAPAHPEGPAAVDDLLNSRTYDYDATHDPRPRPATLSPSVALDETTSQATSDVISESPGQVPPPDPAVKESEARNSNPKGADAASVDSSNSAAAKPPSATPIVDKPQAAEADPAGDSFVLNSAILPDPVLYDRLKTKGLEKHYQELHGIFYTKNLVVAAARCLGLL
ncbi:unnamed protein product [Somion occarium]|uniref:Uncharacterized protein n=1 Tax=Somion occarium TaxID=3059160 RepID=A0ABP1CIB5_9APHY